MARARSEERRADILRATLEVIAERGYRGTTLGGVAERVGLTQQGLLHYFPSRRRCSSPSWRSATSGTPAAGAGGGGAGGWSC